MKTRIVGLATQTFRQGLKGQQCFIPNSIPSPGGGSWHWWWFTSRAAPTQMLHSRNLHLKSPQADCSPFSFSSVSVKNWIRTLPQNGFSQDYFVVNMPTHPLGSVRGMAGHSKWANIRHIKAAKDGEKSRVITDFTRKLRVFIKETGQIDPKTSSQLAKLLSEAKSKNIPSATVDRALAQMVELKNTSPFILEAKGPGGSVLLIEVVTTKFTHTRAELQSLVKKGGFSMFEGGSLARMVFDEKGVVTVSAEGETPDLDKYVELAIEAGAEDVQLEDEDEGGSKVLQFFCGPKEVHGVKKKLEERQLPVRSAETVFFANSRVPMDAAGLDLLAKVMDKLDEHPAVLRVFSNIVDGP